VGGDECYVGLGSWYVYVGLELTAQQLNNMKLNNMKQSSRETDICTFDKTQRYLQI